MIQSPTLSVLGLAPAAADMPLPALPEGTELMDFGALLALTTSQTAPADPADPALPQKLSPAPAANTETATPGNILPPELPLAVPVYEPADLSVDPKAALPDGPELPSPKIPPSKRSSPIQRVLAKDKLQSESDIVPIMEPVPLAPQPKLAPPVALPSALSFAAIGAPLPNQVPVMDEPGELKGEARPRGAALPQPVPAALAHASPQATLLRSAFPDRRAAETAPPASPPAAGSAPAAPQPIAQVRIELAPAVPVMRALAKDDLRPAPGAPSVAALPELPASSAPISAQPNGAAPIPLVQQPAAPDSRPQDFSALIDRLVAARDAAGPQAVAVSVAHAEFGQVHLRFRQDEAGLSVAMASADPAFARAASAMPPVLPVSDPQGGQFQPGPRPDGNPASTQSGTGQQRSPTGERQGGEQPHSHQPQRQTAAANHSGPGRAPRRAGIFA